MLFLKEGFKNLPNSLKRLKLDISQNILGIKKGNL